MSAGNNKPIHVLTDSLHRNINYLRVSVTTDCNFRCLYCYGRPDVRPDLSPVLPADHLNRLLGAFAQIGVKKVRFTGGEPLTRPDLTDIVRSTANIGTITRLAITTNGLMLARRLPGLIEAGLNHINISLDTLHRDRFINLTGVDGLNRVRTGIDKAIESGVFPRVKINTVVIRGINEDEIADFGRWAFETPIDIRFIEFMPTHNSGWGKERLVPEAEIKNRLGLSLTPVPRTDPLAGPAQTFAIDGGRGQVSFISAVSHSFCSECNRLRITADGTVVGCLFGKSAVSLKEILAEEPSEEKLIATLKGILASPGFRRKPTAISITSEQPPMRRIGG